MKQGRNDESRLPSIATARSAVGTLGSSVSRQTSLAGYRLRLIGILELSIFLVSCLFLVWVIGPGIETNGWAPALATIALLIMVHTTYVSPVLIHGDDPAKRGLGSAKTGFLRLDNLRRAVKSFGLLTGIGATIIIGLALVRDPDVLLALDRVAFGKKFVCYLFSATVQNLLLFGWALRRFMGLWPGGQIPYDSLDRRQRAILAGVTGIGFSLAHVPNPTMMILGATLGFLVTLVWLRTPNLIILIGAHAILGTLLHRVLGVSTRIGPHYWQNETFPLREAFPLLRWFIGDSF